MRAKALWSSDVAADMVMCQRLSHMLWVTLRFQQVTDFVSGLGKKCNVWKLVWLAWSCEQCTLEWFWVTWSWCSGCGSLKWQRGDNLCSAPTHFSPPSLSPEHFVTARRWGEGRGLKRTQEAVLSCVCVFQPHPCCSTYQSWFVLCPY